MGAKTLAGAGKASDGMDRAAPQARKVDSGKESAPTAEKEQPQPPAKKRKAGETYADVVKTAEVCYLREKNGKKLSGDDLVEFQDFVCELDLDQNQVDLGVTQAGYRDGCIWFGLKAKESVEWLRNQMHLLKPWKDEHSGYDFFGPGEVPVRVFWVETSDRNALKEDQFGISRFVKLIKKNNKNVFAKETDTITVMDSRPLKGRPGLLLKVSLDRGLVGELARSKFELTYGMGKVRFQKPMARNFAKKAKTGINDDGQRAAGQGPAVDDAMDHDGGADDEDPLADSGDDLNVDALFTPDVDML